MNCRRCGAALSPGALGCPVCGEPVAGADVGVAGDAFAEPAGGVGAGTADDAFAEPIVSASVDAADDTFVEPVAGASAGAAFAEPAAGAGAHGLRADLVPPIVEADKAAPDDVDDPFAPSAGPVFSDGTAFFAQEPTSEQQGFEPLSYMDAPQAAYAAAGPVPAEERPRMRTSSKIVIVLIVLVLVAALAGVASVWATNTRLVAESNVRYTVTYETNGGSRVESQEVKTGTLITAPREPTISGRYFAGWYTDTTYQTQVTFPLEVTSDITLYARWLRDKDKADKALSAQDAAQGATTSTQDLQDAQNSSSQSTQSSQSGTSQGTTTNTQGSQSSNS